MSRNPLSAWLTKHPTMNQNRLAKALGVSRQYVHQMCAEGGSPGIKYAARIAEITGGAVPIAAWHEHWLRESKRAAAS